MVFLAGFSVKSAKNVSRPRHSGAFLDPFARIRCARFEGRFSVLTISPYIQGVRKVEITISILIRPIHPGSGNWWPGWGFCVGISSPRGDVSPPGAANGDF